MEKLYKYPRTKHIDGSKLQKGDEDLLKIKFSTIIKEYLVVEEKIDGANAGISFYNGELKLQSRGHFLTGGHRERHFNLFKKWVNAFIVELYSVLGEKYIMYGEWMYAKHTIFYDKLPHYFLEFDVYDKENDKFLSTEKRKELLSSLVFLHSVPVIKEGYFKNFNEIKDLVTTSLYKSKDWHINLKKICEERTLSYDLAISQTDDSNLSEGLYIKVEKGDHVIERLKYVRQEFTASILSSDSHWLNRPIIPNLLERGELKWTY